MYIANQWSFPKGPPTCGDEDGGGDGACAGWSWCCCCLGRSCCCCCCPSSCWRRRLRQQRPPPLRRAPSAAWISSGRVHVAQLQNDMTICKFVGIVIETRQRAYCLASYQTEAALQYCTYLKISELLKKTFQVPHADSFHSSPSLFMDDSKHFLSLQALHWFLCVLSMGQRPL